MSVPLPDRKPSGQMRQWMLDHVPIRQRLALWYVTLVGLTLSLFSVIVYTTARTQLQTSINDDIRSRAVAISTALERVAESAGDQRGGPFGGSATPAANTPTPTATLIPSPLSTPPTGTPTPLPAPDPNTAAKIQKTLQFQVPEVLGRLDVNFEVLGADGKPQYLTPALTSTGLPINTVAIATGLRGTPTSY
ncbi:MAG: hypothetical protein IVW57_15130, partial [Ktedonobacterales bacterium]|nr:hypothetical protein [Ktedonobacterales bacterium]